MIPHLDATAFSFQRDKMREAGHRSGQLLFAARPDRYLQRDSNAFVVQLHACDQFADRRWRFAFGQQPLAPVRSNRKNLIEL